jgi:hypothetical protein
MKYKFVIILSVLSILSNFVSCDKDHNPTTIENTNTQTDDNDSINNLMSNQMKITIGSTVFTATLYDNETITAFKAMLPLTLNMTDLNANEKYYHFSDNLPTNASNPGTIQIGDLVLYGSNSLVLFYKTFSTSSSYTRFGRINDASELAAAAGSESVMVTFELE